MNNLNNHAVISATNIHKSFRDGKKNVEVLKGIDLKIQQGEMAAIIGASGSGKSTLLQILGGLDSLDNGKVLIEGKDIHQLNATKQGELRNKSLGFVYQFHHLLAEFDAKENVAMPLIIGGINQKLAYERAENMIEKVGLKDRLTHKPSELSGGERQRIAIARAMVSEPACILADEPTGNLDAQTASSINDLMFELNEKDKTSFLIVSHDLSLANSMQKTYQMEDGFLAQVELADHIS